MHVYIYICNYISYMVYTWNNYILHTYNNYIYMNFFDKWQDSRHSIWPLACYLTRWVTLMMLPHQYIENTVLILHNSFLIFQSLNAPTLITWKSITSKNNTSSLPLWLPEILRYYSFIRFICSFSKYWTRTHSLTRKWDVKQSLQLAGVRMWNGTWSFLEPGRERAP